MPSGLPAGVFNMISGLGPVVGEALAGHPDVDMVSFTGSVRGWHAGRGARGARASSVSPSSSAASRRTWCWTTSRTCPRSSRRGLDAFLNAGQTCSALTRLIVPRERLAEVEELARTAAEAHSARRSGPRRDSRSDRSYPRRSTTGSRATSRGHRRRGASRHRRPRAAGRPRRGLLRRADGVLGRRAGMRIAQEEIFGPVLVVIPYDTEDEAIGSPTTPHTASRVASGRAIRPSAPSASRSACAPAR